MVNMKSFSTHELFDIAKDSCKTGNLEDLKNSLEELKVKLSNDPDFSADFLMSNYVTGLLTVACENNHLPIVKWLLTNSLTKDIINIDENNGGPLEEAIVKNNIELLTYLLTNPNLVKTADVHISNDKIFLKACNLGHLESIKLLIECDNIYPYSTNKETNDQKIKEKLESGFIEAFYAKRAEVLEYFLFDLKLQPVDSMHKYLEAFDESQIEKLFGYFENRDLHEKLHTLLPQKPETKKKKL